MPTASLSRGRRGASLLEMVVVTALAALLGLLVSQLIFATSRASQRSQVNLVLQQTAILAMNQLVTDLQSTNAAGISWTLTSAPAARLVLAVQPLAAQFGQPEPSYQDRLVAFSWRADQGSLQRLAWVPPLMPVTLSQQLPTRLDSARLLALPDDASIDERKILAQDVVDLSLVSDIPEPNLASPLKLRLQLRRSIPGKTPAEFLLLQTVSLRNSSL